MAIDTVPPPVAPKPPKETPTDPDQEAALPQTDEHWLAMAALDYYERFMADGLPKSTSVVFRINQLGHAVEKLQWTLDNLYTLARREVNRASRPGHAPVTVEHHQERWGHVLRLCEKAGCQGRTVGVLRDGD